MVPMAHELPDTPLVREALALTRAGLTEDLFQHSCRTYLLARAWGARRKLECDEEGLCLAALLHDAGLCPRWFDAARPFPLNSSGALRDFLRARAVPPARIPPLADAIDFHMSLRPRWDKGTVAGLLQVGAWMDCIGLRVWNVWTEARAIARAHPRLGLTWKVPLHIAASLGSAASCLGLLWPDRYRG